MSYCRAKIIWKLKTLTVFLLFALALSEAGTTAQEAADGKSLFESHSARPMIAALSL